MEGAGRLAEVEQEAPPRSRWHSRSTSGRAHPPRSAATVAVLSRGGPLRARSTSRHRQPLARRLRWSEGPSQDLFRAHPGAAGAPRSAPHADRLLANQREQTDARGRAWPAVQHGRSILSWRSATPASVPDG